jgi:hypothetical protein
MRAILFALLVSCFQHADLNDSYIWHNSAYKLIYCK